MGSYLSILSSMRRKKGSLVPTEVSILEAAIDLRSHGTPLAHGFLLAKEMKEREGARLLTAYGTLYKALDRLRKAGYMEDIWEEPQLAADEGRPRCRFYRVTLAGEAALAKAQEAQQPPAKLQPGEARS